MLLTEEGHLSGPSLWAIKLRLVEQLWQALGQLWDQPWLLQSSSHRWWRWCRASTCNAIFNFLFTMIFAKNMSKISFLFQSNYRCASFLWFHFCSECVKACVQQMNGSWVAVFSLCSHCLTVCSIRLLIVLKCCAASSRCTAEKSAASASSAWKLSIPSSSVTRHAASASIKAPSADERYTTEEEDTDSWFIGWSVESTQCQNKMQAAVHEELWY